MFGESTGRVLINGRRGSLKQHTNLVGLVPQDDIMHAWLTVKECLWFYAKLRHRRRHSSKDVNKKVKSIILQL